MTGLAIEAATEHVEVLVCRNDGEPLAHEVEEVAHGHTRRLVSIIERALSIAGIRPRELGWVVADLGPGSFTGIRVGIASAHALTLVAGSELYGVSSLAALAHGSGARRALLIPLVGAGRRDLYAGFFRADARGSVHLLAAPLVGTPEELLPRAAEMHAALGQPDVRFIGPGAAREQARLEAAFPGSASPPWRDRGLSALDLARAARAGGGPAAGLGGPSSSLHPLYVRSAQAEERVRRRALGTQALHLREFVAGDVPAVAQIERRVFSDPWPESFFISELGTPMVHGRVAECDGRLAGYSLAWLGDDGGHLGNLAVVPELRRRGVGRALLDEVLERAAAGGVDRLTLEVRVSNFAAQWLYRSRGFRVAGLRRRYYRDTGEDALVMEWRGLTNS